MVRGCIAATLCGCADARFAGVSPSESMVVRMRGLWDFPPGEKMVARIVGVSPDENDEMI